MDPELSGSGHLPLPHCYWVLPRRLLAGEYPGGASPEATRARLARLLAAGVRCFLDLTEPGERAPYDAELPVNVDYFRLPIGDHGLPESAAHMVQILERLRGALSAGSIIYLHCRAGIGRTGMVAGCLLAEQCRDAEEALVRLNRCWRQSPLSRSWPATPEPGAQTEYVRRWAHERPGEPDPLLDPATLSAARGLRARFQGTLLGLATGDAVAAATQFGRPGRFTPVGDLLGGGPFDLPRGAWSDDTAMALCLAESLLEHGFDAADQVQRYRRWQQHGYLSATGQCVGITAGTARALALSQWRRHTYSGTHDPESQDPEALSRVAPVALYCFAHPDQAMQYAAEAARTTCQAPAVLAACRSLAQALHAALSGAAKQAILEQARAVPEILPQPVPTPTAPPVPAATAPEALAAALEAFANTVNFRDAVLAAANVGGNSDVVAAVCGALAGAHYTASAIPTLWRNSLMKQQLIESCADRLLAQAMLDFGT
jgi:ADP-ribosyl-[dinitrogen reductase] hydrolase